MPLDQTDTVGAFIPGPRARLEPLAGDGPLSGVVFAAKDLFDVAGVVTTFGSPAWAETHGPAAATAPVINALLEAGAALVGKTKTVELAFGMTGENLWHGTPVNPAAPDRYPGGSSCGSAAAVAAALVPLALGSDTGGSVRIPASYCGIFGIRPSHGAISLAGACPLAPSYDTPGWFAASAGLLLAAGEALLAQDVGRADGPLLLAEEAWEAADPDIAAVLRDALAKLERWAGPAVPIRYAPEGLEAQHAHFRALQAEEAWAVHGAWLRRVKPDLTAAVAARFAFAETLDPALAAAGRRYRRLLRSRILPLLAGGAVLVQPTSPCTAPLLTSETAALEAVRVRTVGVTALANLCGLPEVSLPAGRTDAPVGLSLVGAPGSDLALLRFARAAAGRLGLPD